MGFFNKLMNAGDKLVKMAGMGSATLQAAYVQKQAPTGSGVYQIRYQGQLMKVGMAKDGLRKRFSDYYRGLSGGTAGLRHITEDNRDRIIVSWKECPRDECRAREKYMYDNFKNQGEEMPWAERR